MSRSTRKISGVRIVEAFVLYLKAKNGPAEGLINTVKAGGFLREKAIKAGFLTKEDCEEITAAWRAWAEGEDSNISMMHGEIIIEK